LDSFITSLLKQIILAIVERRGFLVMANLLASKKNSLEIYELVVVVVVCFGILISAVN
jgi:hypothetical protein